MSEQKKSQISSSSRIASQTRNERLIKGANKEVQQCIVVEDKGDNRRRIRHRFRPMQVPSMSNPAA